MFFCWLAAHALSVYLVFACFIFAFASFAEDVDFLVAKGCDVWQAKWEYFDNTDYESYPDEINIIIENAYQENKQFAEWEEENARYRLTFDTMEEEMANDASSKVKVRRTTKGEWLDESEVSGYLLYVRVQDFNTHKMSVTLAE